MNDAIIEKMWDCEQYRAVVSLADGRVLHGFVDVFESRYDNDGEASICFASEDGEMLILEESDILDIRKEDEELRAI